MFTQKPKSELAYAGIATIIASGATLKGDINSSGDIRIDGTLRGNVHCSAKVVIGAHGVVEGDIHGQQADIMGNVKGNLHVKELLQLKGNGQINGNIYASKLQVEPSAQFNGQCKMSGSDPSGNWKVTGNKDGQNQAAA